MRNHHSAPVVTWMRGPMRVLLVVAALELVVGRVAVEALRPTHAAPPGWHAALSYVALFLYYFTTTLAAGVLATELGPWRRERRGRVGRGAAAIAAGAFVVLIAVALIAAVHTTGSTTALVLELALVIGASAAALACVGEPIGLGGGIGLVLVVAPVIVHAVVELGARYVWSDSQFDGPGVQLQRLVTTALCVGALASPYCFAPRPLAPSMTRLPPIIAAMVFAVAATVVVRWSYLEATHVVRLAFGIELGTTAADPRLALLVLAGATLVWTLVSCGLADTQARREIGRGILLVALGGAAFRWPHQYLLIALGVMTIARASRRARMEEASALGVIGPTIGPEVWSAYVAHVVTTMRDRFGSAHAATSRTDTHEATTKIVTDVGGTAVRIEITQIDGVVAVVDACIGQAAPAGAAPSWTVVHRTLDIIDPVVVTAGAPPLPGFTVDDPAFATRFETRGDVAALARALDGKHRSQLATLLDGWLGGWRGFGVRLRTYPGAGTSLDHPVPLADLGAGVIPPACGERWIALLETLVGLAATTAGPAPELLGEGTQDAAS